MFTLDGILVDTTNKFNNMVHQNLWNKLDPKDEKLLALTTKLQDLKAQMNSFDSAYSRGKQNQNLEGHQLEAWQIKKGEEMKFNGRWLNFHNFCEINLSYIPGSLAITHMRYSFYA